ncbi:Nose resistant to fluoxetine protein 6 [Mizuhopecten yessoensis]|uniref:Nose resistant to fluoxetine protein 6 n=1 Tax=Mizuhopecten yessoensis TaxID=6573 RepID=A0A210QY11_MIZYE|nr:Nose resistant to fluoxetine protein 6 [Mizuhopecten yessoensis]
MAVIAIFVLIFCAADIRGGLSTPSSPLSPQRFLELLQQGMNMSNTVMTLDEILSTLALLPTMDEQKVTLILQDLNLNMSNPQLAEALVGLQSLVSWGTIVLPNGNVADLFNTMSTMDDQNLMFMLDSLNIDGLDPSQLRDAISVLQYIQNSSSSPDDNVPLPNPNLDDLFNMTSTMDEQSLKQLLQSLNIDANIDPSQLGDALTILQSLQSALSGGNALLPNVDLEDLLNMMTVMDDNSLTLLLQSLNIDSSGISQLGDAMTLLQSLQSAIFDGNVILPSPNLDDLLNLISTVDEQSLKQLLQSLNIDANIDPSQLGGALIILQSLQSALSDGNPLLPNVDLDDLLKIMTAMDEQSLTLLLQSLNIDALDPSQLGDAMILFQTLQSAITNGNFQFSNGTDFNPLDYLDLGLLSDRCSVAMGALASGVVEQKPWAFQMIDSWGKPHAGMLDGNTRWLGSYDQCLAVQPEVNGNTPFETNYCVSGNQSAVLLGTCLPKSCTENDINSITSALLDLIPLSEPLTIDYVQCKRETEHDTKAIVATCVCSFFLALMVFATLYDVIIVSPKQKKKAKQIAEATKDDVGKKANELPGISTVENGIKNDISKSSNDSSEIATLENKVEDDSSKNANSASEISSVRKKMEDDVSKNLNGFSEVSTSENGANRHYVEIKFNTKTGKMETNGTSPGCMFTPNEHNVELKTTSTSQGLCEKLIISFSVWTNGKRLLNTEQTAGTLGAINGIRFFSMSWVILAHSFTNVIDHNMFVDQWSGVSNLLQRRSFMAVSNSNVSMDTFFAMSGLLVSYVFMNEMKREKGRINWFMFYCHRFWRLTPPYMLVMMMDIALFRYVGDGPTWNPNGIENDFCKDTWWTNLAYVNNIVKDDKMCFAWSWYLANDMQFYVISPLLLVPLYFSKKIGGFVSMLFLLGVTIVSAVISVHFELPSSQFSLKPSPHAADYFPNYYIKPYCRMGPYIIGIIAGYILYRTGGKYKIKTPLNLFIWAFMTTLGCLVVYGTYEETNGNAMSVGVAALYNAVHKTLWGVCVCWVVFACVTGNGGYINTILSWSPFVPLGRLTYCAYLVHPLVMYAYYSSLRQGIYGTDFNIIYLFMGHLVISYMVAFVISLAFESPMMALERTILKKDRKKNK